MLDPHKQECFGFFLYGAGAMARDENTLGVALGREANDHTCSRCPRRVECEAEFERRVRDAMPWAVERFERAMTVGTKRGYPPSLVKAYLAKKDQDPFASMAIDNFKRGHADRGRRDGALLRAVEGGGDGGDGQG
jgi:hypothetical protein